MRRLPYAVPGSVLLLTVLNAYVCWNYLGAGYIEQMGSIDAAYISLARYISDNWGDLTWFPLWYGGIPFQNTYPPLLHLLGGALRSLTGASPAVAHHAVSGALYILGPVTLFLLAYRLSRELWPSLVSGLVYSVFSPILLLVPAVARDSGGLFVPRRLQTLLQYGEGPHVSAMTLLPVAVLALDVALEKRRPVWYLLAALALASVVLTNWIGGAALAAAVVAYLLSRPAPRVRGWFESAVIGAGAYLLAAPWIPPSTLATVRANAQVLGGNYQLTFQHLKYAGVLVAGIAALDFLLARYRARPMIRFSAVFTLIMAGIVLSAQWLDIRVLPQPERYHLELETALVPLVVFACGGLLRGLTRVHWAAFAAGLALFVGVQAKHCRGYANFNARPTDITTKVEYQAARWFDQHAAGQRVVAAGSAGFWMNAFTDTPQFRGGFDQGITNPLLYASTYQIYSGEGAGEREGEIAELWLRAYGVGAVFVPGRNGREVFKDVRNPRKYEGRFQEAWRDGDDSIWTIPRHSTSVAHVMRRQDLPARAPNGGLDVEPLRPYVKALEDPALPPAPLRWTSRHSARIDTTMSRGQILSVQIAYHHGWKALVAGRSVPVWRDPLNQMAIAPGCNGPCAVDLVYDGGLEMLLARLASWGTLGGALLWIGWDWRQRRAPAPQPA